MGTLKCFKLSVITMIVRVFKLPKFENTFVRGLRTTDTDEIKLTLTGALG